MIALKVKQQKVFMAKLLTTEAFDDFLVTEATIDTYDTFHIDGKINKEFYQDGELPDTDHSKWSTIRPIALELIKGKITPLGFKFVLQLDSKRKEELLKNSDADLNPDQVSLGINIRFANGEVIITTGISYSLFTLDKSAEKAWDEYIPSLLDSYDISNDIL